MTRDEDLALEKFLDEMVAKGVTFFLSYHCAHNGLSLGPSPSLRHTSPSRTDYDSYTSF
jgi:hypothetical protein